MMTSLVPSITHRLQLLKLYSFLSETQDISTDHTYTVNYPHHDILGITMDISSIIVDAPCFSVHSLLY